MRKFFYRLLLCASLFIYCNAVANEISEQDLIKMVESANQSTLAPEIKDAYDKLSAAIKQAESIDRDYKSDLQKNYDDTKAKEQSVASRTTAAAAIGAMGAGAEKTLAAKAEQSADEAAEANMKAYLETFRCDFGQGRNIKGGEKKKELPAITGLAPIKSEYMTLAQSLKELKEELGMRPGIESELILNAAETGLYDDVSLGKTGGAYASLARAMMDEESEDAKALAEQKAETASNLKTGKGLLIGGAVVGVASNVLIETLDKRKEKSAQINQEHDKQSSANQTTRMEAKTNLQTAIENNQKQVDDFNTQLKQQKEFVKKINDPDCRRDFADYIKDINNMTPATDNLADMSNMRQYDLAVQQSQYDECVVAATAARQSAKEKTECARTTNGTWDAAADVCVISPTPADTTTNDATTGAAVIAADAGNDTDAPQSQQNPEQMTTDAAVVDETLCPDENPRFKKINGMGARVGDFCAYGNVLTGKIFKFKPGATRGGKNVGGTCSCTAKQCKTGYKLQNGMCTAISETSPEYVKLEYHTVCGEDAGKSGGAEFCIKDFFNKTNVTMLAAQGLAMEYARAKNNHTVQCANTRRTSWNDDYITCTSVDNKNFYEFKFDDVKESVDTKVQNDTHVAVCKIHGAAATAAGCSGGGTNVSAQTICWDASCDAGESKCGEINQTMQRFGYSAKYNDGKCQIDFNGVNSEDSLRTAYGINNFVFCSNDIQLQASGQIVEYIKRYVTDNAGAPITSFKCDKGYKIYRGTGCKYNNITDFKDNLLTCYANGNPIDFIFDDLSENWDAYDKGARQAMQCMVSGGTFAGKQCMGLEQSQCTALRDANIKDCPECKQIYWDKDEGICRLPSSAHAANLSLGVKVGTMVAGIVAGAVITIGTMGSGTPMVALVLTETAGGVIDVVTEIKMSKAAQEFLTASQKCKSSDCAEQMIENNMQRMSNLSSHFTDSEVDAIDKELARLINLLPEDAAIYKKTLAEYDLGFFDGKSWEPEQVWQAIGIVMQFASIGSAIWKATAKKLNHATEAFKTGLQKFTNHTDDVAHGAQLSTHTANGARASENATGGARASAGANSGKTSSAGASGGKKASAGGADNAKNAAGGARNANGAGPATVDELRRGAGLEQNFEGILATADGDVYVSRVNMTADEIRKLKRTAEKHGFFMENGGDSNNIVFRKKPANAGAAKNADNAPHNDAHAGTAKPQDADSDQLKKIMQSVGMHEHPYNGHSAFVSKILNEDDAVALANAQQQQGFISTILNAGGTSKNSKYIVISMTEDEASKIGTSFSRSSVLRSRDISRQMDNLRRLANGTELGRINGMSVSIESIADFGANGGRPILMVKVGNRKIPFYASSGSAGKTSVATGEWEFFGGIGREGWFNKGDLDAIKNHYGSAELKQIADILDAKIGDLRDTEMILETIGRQSLGGVGDVAMLRNAPDIDAGTINRALRYTPTPSPKSSDPGFRNNLNDIINYLRNGM